MWAECLDGFRQQRTWERARRLGLSPPRQTCLGRHTVTGVLCTCGRQFVDWSADYRVFSKDQWEPESPFLPVIRGVLEQLADDEPFVAALDDTLLRKTGTKTPGVGYAIDLLEANSNDFAARPSASRKSLKLDLPVTSALLYASAG